MKDNKLHTPMGMRDFLTGFCGAKLEIQEQLSKIFYQYGYSPIECPTMEYLEVFEGTGSVSPQQMFCTQDRDGETLVMRSDITPQAVRVAVTSFDETDYPLRFSYTGNVFRNNESDQGKLREYTHCGVELIGVNSREADAEVVALAIRSLLAAGLSDFRIDIGQVQFFEGLFEELMRFGMDTRSCQKIQNYIIQGDFISAQRQAEKYALPENLRTIFQELPILIGGKDMLSKVSSLIDNQKINASINDLLEIYNILKDHRLSCYINFDLSMLGHLDYYTGFIFRGYTHGIGFSLLGGGRYDKLISKFGKECPSVGFSIKIFDLLSAMQNLDKIRPQPRIETLVAYGREGRMRALTTADALRAQGIGVENSLIDAKLDVQIQYAKRKNMSGIIYFFDSENIRLIDLIDGQQADMTIQDLLGEEKEEAACRGQASSFRTQQSEEKEEV